MGILLLCMAIAGIAAFIVCMVLFVKEDNPIYIILMFMAGIIMGVSLGFFFRPSSGQVKTVILEEKIVPLTDESVVYQGGCKPVVTIEDEDGNVHYAKEIYSIDANKTSYAKKVTSQTYILDIPMSEKITYKAYLSKGR